MATYCFKGWFWAKSIDQTTPRAWPRLPSFRRDTFAMGRLGLVRWLMLLLVMLPVLLLPKMNLVVFRTLRMMLLMMRMRLMGHQNH